MSCNERTPSSFREPVRLTTGSAARAELRQDGRLTKKCPGKWGPGAEEAAVEPLLRLERRRVNRQR